MLYIVTAINLLDDLRVVASRLTGFVACARRLNRLYPASRPKILILMMLIHIVLLLAQQYML
ncbi:MAG: hypothetical protein U5N85_11335, partial [Arcicella sp.]|nr:hypothetical protein [Arcicella sp.]